jgi:hypothetical protein
VTLPLVVKEGIAGIMENNYHMRKNIWHYVGMLEEVVSSVRPYQKEAV